ncbi:response regulator [Rhizobiales bacterium RZME27]|uniref:Response regulator n=1 Tax=Endobacterium cereale TaxID=2663029 RepID=A0A6A8A3Y5_9HYPH|nr:response regulator transcription factor [Endobacterium cereale]MEB2844698.1 response regulator transcription factor [Endobacterium cereale]MQY45479.1 response regulator [Endobacterium cereale]
MQTLTLTMIIADDHPLFRGALRQAVNDIGYIQTIIEAGDFEAARKAAGDQPDTDLMLLDLNMPGVSGFSGLTALRSEFPGLPVIVVSASDDSTTISRALELGASGFISKSAGLDDIRMAVDTVLDGGIWTGAAGSTQKHCSDPAMTELMERMKTLTPQQSKVLTMLGKGLLNKQIAYALGVSEATIKAHVSAILLKLNVDSRTQAVIKLGQVNLAMVA